MHIRIFANVHSMFGLLRIYKKSKDTPIFLFIFFCRCCWLSTTATRSIPSVYICLPFYWKIYDCMLQCISNELLLLSWVLKYQMRWLRLSWHNLLKWYCICNCLQSIQLLHSPNVLFVCMHSTIICQWLIYLLFARTWSIALDISSTFCVIAKWKLTVY